MLVLREKAAYGLPNFTVSMPKLAKIFPGTTPFPKLAIVDSSKVNQMLTYSEWISPKKVEFGRFLQTSLQLKKSESTIAIITAENITSNITKSILTNRKTYLNTPNFDWLVLQDPTVPSNHSDRGMLDSWGGVNRGCSESPDGFGFPGFPPGSSRSAVEQMLGVPATELPGYWSNTIALVYQLVPNQVSLGLLFDQNTQILAQTEASFDVAMGIDALFNTFNTMIGCRLDEKLRQGVRLVWSGEREVYDFNLGQIRGTVQWETSTRIYIGVWQSGLHSSLTRSEADVK